MNPEKLRDSNEDIRRFEIIDISRSSCSEAADDLLCIYSSETYENKRHIVRAYGNIGGSKLEIELLKLLSFEKGVILGDICKSLGELGLTSAEAEIRLLQSHELQWVSQNANWALKQFKVLSSAKQN
jgi:hypothetical protein